MTVTRHLAGTLNAYDTNDMLSHRGKEKENTANAVISLVVSWKQA